MLLEKSTTGLKRHMHSSLCSPMRLLLAGLFLCVARAAAGEDELAKSPGYLKLPVQKWYGPVDSKGFSKRDNGMVNASLSNQITQYLAELQVGTPPQRVFVQVDTGSSDLLIINPNNKFCEQDSDSHLSVLTDNSALTGTATAQVETNTFLSNNYFTPCSYYGTFNLNGSSTFKTNNSAAELEYGSGSARGIQAEDTVAISDATIKNFNFVLANDTDINPGILGISIAQVESTLGQNKTFHNNFPLRLQEQGTIERVVYSLYLNNVTENYGTLLFGAVNNNKYSGTLYTLPMLETFLDPDQAAIGMFITANDVTIEDAKHGNRTVSTKQFPVLFDSGTSYAALYPDIADPIAEAFEGKYNERNSGYDFDCDKVDESTRLSIDFGGFNISCRMSNFVARNDNHTCTLQIVRSNYISVLGDAFLVDAYVVFDLENYEVSVAQARFDSENDEIELVTGSTIPGATQAPGYSNTWTHTPGDAIGEHNTISALANGTSVSLVATSTEEFSSTEPSSSTRNMGLCAEPFSLGFFFSSIISALFI